LFRGRCEILAGEFSGLDLLVLFHQGKRTMEIVSSVTVLFEGSKRTKKSFGAKEPSVDWFSNRSVAEFELARQNLTQP